MKRSEIIENLAEFMYDGFKGETTFRTIASDIVAFLEKEGMLPPLAEHRMFDNDTYKAHKWNREDE